MRRFNLDQLETLTVVLDLGSFSAAARRLNLSQPAISHQIRDLETKLGVQLIDRVGKKALATDAGRDFLPLARRLISEADAAANHMRRHREGHVGTVRIGTANNVIVWVLPEILRDLRRIAPGIEIAIHADWTRPTIDKILANELDVGIVTLPVPPGTPLEVEDWRDEPSYALFSAERADLPERVTPEMLAREPLILPRSYGTIRQLIDGWFATADIVPKPIIELSNSEAIKSLVAADVGVTVLPGEYGEFHGRGRLVARPLAPLLTRRLAIVTRRSVMPDPALKIFLETLRAAPTTTPTGAMDARF